MMLTWFKNSSLNRTWGLLVSLGLHGVLLFIFLYIQLRWETQIPEFAEITFVSAQAYPGNYMPAAGESPAQPEESIKETESEVVQLPQRRMLEYEEPQLQTREITKLIPEESPNAVRNKEDFGGYGDTGREIPRVPVEEKEVARATALHLEEKGMPDLRRDFGESVSPPFEIEGEAAQRSVIFKVIPEYPSGLQKEAVVKIQFTVLPNGLVGEAIPILKSEATLEKLALEAFRQWRFNPLPADKPQVPEKGVITFRYILK